MSASRYLLLLSTVVVMSSIGRVVAAENICNETVPADRYIDGIPAYNQCDASRNSSVFSDDGVNTSTTSLGAEWVSTQRGGGYQCTEYANRYLRFTWNVTYRSGWARDWCDGNLPATLVKNTIPVHGDVVVFIPGECGADPSNGHVAVVDSVDMARSRFTFVEQNRAGRRSCNLSSAICFLHVVANDGSSIDAGIVFDAGQTPDAGLIDSGAGETAPDGASAVDSAGNSGGNGGRDGFAGFGGQINGTGGGGYGVGGTSAAGDNSSGTGNPDIVGLAGSSHTATGGITDSQVNLEDPAQYGQQNGCSCDLAGQRRHRENVWLFFVIGLLSLAARRRNARNIVVEARRMQRSKRQYKPNNARFKRNSRSADTGSWELSVFQK